MSLLSDFIYASITWFTSVALIIRTLRLWVKLRQDAQLQNQPGDLSRYHCMAVVNIRSKNRETGENVNISDDLQGKVKGTERPVKTIVQPNSSTGLHLAY